MKIVPWIMTVDIDILPLIAPRAPEVFKDLNPRTISKNLGRYNLDKWKYVLSDYRTKLVRRPSPRLPRWQAGGVLDDVKWKIQIDLLMHEDGLPCDMRFHVLQTLLHEMVHVQQFSCNPDTQYYPTTSSKVKKSSQEYLALKGEVKAFAHCAFLEFQNDGQLISSSRNRYKDMPKSTQKAFDRELQLWEERYIKFGVSLRFTL